MTAWAKAHSTRSFELDIGEHEFDIGVSVVGIELRLIGNVEEFVLEQLLFQFSEPKADTAHSICIVGYGEL